MTKTTSELRSAIGLLVRHLSLQDEDLIHLREQKRRLKRQLVYSYAMATVFFVAAVAGWMR